MNEDDAKFLDTFAAWLRGLGHDVGQIGEIVTVAELAEPARRALVGSLNYLFKSLDLIPDGIDDIGYLDDAFVLRCACDQALREDLSALAPESLRDLNRLAEDAELIRSFLGEDFARLNDYVTGLRKGAARGRSVDDILADEGTQADFVSDINGFSRAFEAPRFSREEKNLIKLRAFFDAKLPK
ncbi:MAG: YkvA family protein [Myxococcales bacterium]|nr:YkvA family protein [Myxococcales bacterium]MDD9967010.1 YkvA family protein [Myxococcales bacterium]